jgi:hypothetical protein
MSSTTSIAAPAQSPCKAAVATPARVTDPPCIDAATPTAAATKSEPRAPTPVVRAATEVPPRVAVGGTTLAVQRAIDDHCAQLARLRELVARSEAHRGEVDRFCFSLAPEVLAHHRRRSEHATQDAGDSDAGTPSRRVAAAQLAFEGHCAVERSTLRRLEANEAYTTEVLQSTKEVLLIAAESADRVATLRGWLDVCIVLCACGVVWFSLI